MQQRSKQLYRSQTIRRFIAAALLLLFALNVAPKQLLHDVITGHKHGFAKASEYQSFQSSKKGIQCHWHNNVVESPFIDVPDFQVQELLPAYSSLVNYYSSNYHSADLFYSSLRGPPIMLG